MSKTAISWAEETLNPFVGCSPVSEGCANCYAAEVSGQSKLQKFPQYQGVLTQSGKWNGRINFVPEVLKKLVRMTRPRTIFMPSMSDPFHEAIPDELLDQVFAAIALVPHIQIMMLTKRGERMRSYFESLYTQRLSNAAEKHFSKSLVFNESFCSRSIPNLMLGVSVENQYWANQRIPLLLETPVSKRFVSIEPMLGAIDLERIVTDFGDISSFHNKFGTSIDLVICGGESGKNARTFECDWARSLADQCHSAGVQFHLKQLGQFPLDKGEPIDAGFKGQDVSKWPEDLRQYH